MVGSVELATNGFTSMAATCVVPSLAARARTGMAPGVAVLSNSATPSTPPGPGPGMGSSVPA